jgi:hypothetical protein
MEILRLGELLADQAGADHLSVDLDQRAVGLVVEQQLGRAGHEERVDHAGDDHQHHGHQQAGEQQPAGGTGG